MTRIFLQTRGAIAKRTVVFASSGRDYEESATDCDEFLLERWLVLENRGLSGGFIAICLFIYYRHCRGFDHHRIVQFLARRERRVERDRIN